MSLAVQVVSTLAVVAAALSVLYVGACVAVVLARRRRARRPPPARQVPITVVKPLCGAEPGLEENLRSFCRDAGADTQFLFGARDAGDPALAVVRRVLADYPELDAGVAVGAVPLGLNAKINTVAGLLPMARHGLVMIADSDARIAPGDLQRIAAPLMDPAVGVVSCLFRSRPTDSFWSRFGGLSIDEWFMPSVLVSRALHSAGYCSGPVVALRRDVLDEIGGVAPLACMLADDYELGARVRRLGYRSLLADCEVTVTVHEATCGDLARHEIRWMRTTRTVTPAGHAALILTYTVPLAVAAVAATGAGVLSLALLGAAIACRAAVHWAVGVPADAQGRPTRRLAPLWMVLVRDFFSFGMWAASYAGRTITWRGRALRVGHDGVLRIPAERETRRLLPRVARPLSRLLARADRPIGSSASPI